MNHEPYETVDYDSHTPEPESPSPTLLLAHLPTSAPAPDLSGTVSPVPDVLAVADTILSRFTLIEEVQNRILTLVELTVTHLEEIISNRDSANPADSPPPDSSNISMASIDSLPTDGPDFLNSPLTGQIFSSFADMDGTMFTSTPTSASSMEHHVIYHYNHQNSRFGWFNYNDNGFPTNEVAFAVIMLIRRLVPRGTMNRKPISIRLATATARVLRNDLHVLLEDMAEERLSYNDGEVPDRITVPIVRSTPDNLRFKCEHFTINGPYLDFIKWFVELGLYPEEIRAMRAWSMGVDWIDNFPITTMDRVISL